MPDGLGLGVVPCWRSDTDFKYRYTQNDLSELLHLALDYSKQSSTAYCYYLYRNKRSTYYQNIRTKSNIMFPCLKNNSGDPKSPLNGKVYGLFFTASVQHGSTIGQPYKKSPFGDTRLLVPVEFLIDWHVTNLYFADFYCLNSNHHYVTLVVTQPYSEVDLFCWEKLIRLNIRDNQFFFYNGKTFRVIDKKYLTVEILYANKVSINDVMKRGGFFQHDVPTIGKGYVTHKGNTKNSSCSLCNIYRPNENYFHRGIGFHHNYHFDPIFEISRQFLEKCNIDSSQEQGLQQSWEDNQASLLPMLSYLFSKK